MKPKTRHVKLRTALAFCLAAGLVVAQHVPSQRYASELDSTSRAFLVHPSPDMRTFVCERFFIDERIKRKVCLLDFIAPTNRPGRLQPREPYAAGGRTLEQILRAEHLELELDSRQIRVFKENSIQQDFSLSKESTEKLRTLIIDPGDIVTFLPRR